MISNARFLTAAALDLEDFSYKLSAAAILTALEVEIGIINASLPTINPVFNRYSKCAERARQLQSMGNFRGIRRSSSSQRPLNSSRLYNSGEESNAAAMYREQQRHPRLLPIEGEP